MTYRLVGQGLFAPVMGAVLRKRVDEFLNVPSGDLIEPHMSERIVSPFGQVAFTHQGRVFVIELGVVLEPLLCEGLKFDTCRYLPSRAFILKQNHLSVELLFDLESYWDRGATSSSAGPVCPQHRIRRIL